MQLFVIRHAIAVPRSARTPDAERPLTPEGRKKWKRAARGLDRLGVKLDGLLHSPWRRAVETAAELRELVDGETIASDALARKPGRDLFAAIEKLDCDRVAVVGHEPWLGQLVALLVLGSASDGARFALKKGAVVVLEGKPRSGGMTLHALLPPRVLRAVRGS